MFVKICRLPPNCSPFMKGLVQLPECSQSWKQVNFLVLPNSISSASNLGILLRDDLTVFSEFLFFNTNNFYIL